MKKHAADLGKVVARERIRQGISQELLALRMGSTQATVSRMENGVGDTSLEKVIEAAEALWIKITVHAEPANGT